MRIIVVHKSPDLDAICSVWLLKRFVSGWENAEVEYVPAGEKKEGLSKNFDGPIDVYDDNQVIHADTGLGPLDHHQTQDNNVCAASLTFEYVKKQRNNSIIEHETKTEAIRRIVEYTINEDHFQEVHYDSDLSELYDFSVARLIDGFKVIHPGEDKLCIQFGMECLDITLHVLERRIWAENEIKEKGIEFNTRFGKALAIESVNDTVLEVAQKTGHTIAARKDPNHGYIRIKAKPRIRNQELGIKNQEFEVDLTPAYEKIIKMDPEGRWYLHISKKMLLNGSSKNPTMAASKLSLQDIIEVLKSI